MRVGSEQYRHVRFGSEADVTAPAAFVRFVPEADFGDPLPAAIMSSRPSCHTAGVISGWGGRPRLDKDERKIVHRHLDELE